MIKENLTTLTFHLTTEGSSFCTPSLDGRMNGVSEHGDPGSFESCLSTNITVSWLLCTLLFSVASLKVTLPPVIMLESFWFFGELERDRHTVIFTFIGFKLLLLWWICVSSLGGVLRFGSSLGLVSFNLQDRGTVIFLICLRTLIIPLVLDGPFLGSRSLVEKGEG